MAVATYVCEPCGLTLGYWYDEPEAGYLDEAHVVQSMAGHLDLEHGAVV